MTLILYGRYLSPFVRRVAIWCNLQGRPYDHRPLMVGGEDWPKLREINPVGRVPALVTPDGMLTETFVITDWLDETAPERRLVPAAGPARFETMALIGVAHATAEKGVALVNEKNRRPEPFQWAEWRARLESQVASGLAEMEAAAPASGFLGGDTPNGADVALAVAWDFVGASNPYLREAGYPKLAALAGLASGLREVSDTFPPNTA